MTTAFYSAIPKRANFAAILCITATMLAFLLAGCGGMSATAKVAPTPVASPTPNPNALVYATDSFGGLFVFHPKNQSMMSIPVTGGAAGLALTPDGSRAYVTQETTNSVAVVDTQENTVVGVIPVGNMPMAVAVSPDGKFAYVANTNSGTVSVIDTRSNTVTNTITTDSAPFTLAFSADGTQVYVALLLFDGIHLGGPNPENAIVVIDAASQTISKKLPLIASTSMAASPTRAEMYVVEPGFGLVVLDTKTNQVVSQIALDNDQQTGIAVSPDGKSIYVTEHGMVDIGHVVPPDPTIPSTVYVISADQRAPVAKAQTDPGLIAIALSPDGMTAYLLADETSLAGMRTMDTHALTFTPTQPLAGSPMRIAIGNH